MANGHGGKRPGAGRPKKAKNKPYAEIDKMLAGKSTPLDVLEALLVKKRYTKNDKFRLEVAKAMAPYCHPRLSSAEVIQEQRGEVVHRVIGAQPDLDIDEWQQQYNSNGHGDRSPDPKAH